MPVSPAAQYHNAHSQTQKSNGSDNSSAFAYTLLKQQAVAARKNAPFDIASSSGVLEPGRQQYSKAGNVSSQTPLSSRNVQNYQDVENESQQGRNSDLNNKTPVANKESRAVRIQNHLQGLLKNNSINILLGTISKTNPTVSHVVRNNENIHGYHWDIIHAKININKPYSTSSLGTRVSINPNTLELFFEGPHNFKNKEIPTSEKLQVTAAPQQLSRTEELINKLQQLSLTENSPFVLGSLSEEIPTVSQVVNKNEYTKGLYKEIIYSKINRDKPFTRLKPGTKISINPATFELTFKEPLIFKARKGTLAGSSPNVPVRGLSKNEHLRQYVASLEPDSNKLIKIGELSCDLPTISQVLNNDQRFAGYHWGIILSDINSDKPFNSLAPGTQVSINPDNLELLFNVSDSPLKIFPSKPGPTFERTNSEDRDTSQPALSQQTSSLHQYVAGLESDNNQHIAVGTLTDDLPTISQVLNNDQRFAGYHWDIIFSDINNNKPFNNLAPGTQISINPENLELLFNSPSSPGKLRKAPISNKVITPVKTPIVEPEQLDNLKLTDAVPVPPKPEPPKEKAELSPSQEVKAPLKPEPEIEERKISTLMKSQSSALYHQKLQKENVPVSFTEKLAASARQMVGKFSSEVNNYELLLGGLESQGIEYEGKGGLKENLGQLASLMWLEESALQNVGGIVKIAGETVYSKTIAKDATQEQLNDFTYKMAYYLEKGQVITMSTPTINQSGIISSKQDGWTIINSNQIVEGRKNDSSDMKRVDEVPLNQRIAELHSKTEKNAERLSVKLSWLEENILRNTDKLIDLKKRKMGLFSKFPIPKLTP